MYYVVAESLTNAAKHSGASEAWVELSTTTDTVVVEIRDNGSGGADLGKGTGLRGLADRVEALGGTLRLQSGADQRNLRPRRAADPLSKDCATSSILDARRQEQVSEHLISALGGLTPD